MPYGIDIQNLNNRTQTTTIEGDQHGTIVNKKSDGQVIL
jgi:hypothetical protein